MPIGITTTADTLKHGEQVELQATGVGARRTIEWTVVDLGGREVGLLTDRTSSPTMWRPTDDVAPGQHIVRLVARDAAGNEEPAEKQIVVEARPYSPGETVPVRIDGPVPVDLQRIQIADTPDLALWEVIKLSTEAISFSNYKAFMDYLFCGGELPQTLYKTKSAWKKQSQAHDDMTAAGPRWIELGSNITRNGARRAPIPFPDIESYKVLKAATEAFLVVNCDVAFDKPAFPTLRSLSPADRERLGLEQGTT